MILPTTALTVWILAIVSLLCLGSWANTLKLAGKWRFEYFYFDFVFGMLLFAGVSALVLGSGRAQELTFQDNLLLVGYRKMAWAMAGGVVLNLGMLLLLAATSIAGMSVAFPLTLGVALVIGAVWDFANATQAGAVLTFIGVALLLGAVSVAGLAYVQLLQVYRAAAQKALTPDPRTKSKRPKSAGTGLVIILSVVGGIALSTFPKILDQAIGEGGLAPYSVVVLLSVAALLSSPFFVLFFTTFPVTGTPGMPSGYFAGSRKQHLLGVTGGIVWGAGMLTSLMTAAAPQNVQPSPLIQYLLNNGVLLVAVAWGLLAWQEFRGGGDRVRMLAAGMVVLFLAGLGMVAFAFSPK
jgi:glucose uptake protein